MKQLAQISFNQRVRIAKFDNFLENVLKQRATLAILENRDFETNFQNIFELKMRSLQDSRKSTHEPRPDRSLRRTHVTERSNNQSASVSDINEMINSLCVNQQASSHDARRDESHADGADQGPHEETEMR